MRKNPFEEVDPDLKAMRGSMRSSSPVRWGRVLVGIVVVGFATFAFAYYLPLQKAHETLTKRYAELKSQAETTSEQLEQTRGQAKAASEKSQELEGQLEGIKQREDARAKASRSLKTTLDSKLQRLSSKGHAAVGVSGSVVAAALSLPHIVSPKFEVVPLGQLALCNVSAAADKRTIKVLTLVDEPSIPSGLTAKFPTPLEYASAVSALVARTLLDKCKAEPSRVSAVGVPVEPSAAPQLEGKRLTGPRVELWLEAAP
jgi:hypothetical protein